MPFLAEAMDLKLNRCSRPVVSQVRQCRVLASRRHRAAVVVLMVRAVPAVGRVAPVATPPVVQAAADSPAAVQVAADSRAAAAREVDSVAGRPAVDVDANPRAGS